MKTRNTYKQKIYDLLLSDENINLELFQNTIKLTKHDQKIEEELSKISEIVTVKYETAVFEKNIKN